MACCLYAAYVLEKIYLKITLSLANLQNSLPSGTDPASSKHVYVMAEGGSSPVCVRRKWHWLCELRSHAKYMEILGENVWLQGSRCTIWQKAIFSPPRTTKEWAHFMNWCLERQMPYILPFPDRWVQATRLREGNKLGIFFLLEQNWPRMPTVSGNALAKKVRVVTEMTQILAPD